MKPNSHLYIVNRKKKKIQRKCVFVAYDFPLIFHKSGSVREHVHIFLFLLEIFMKRFIFIKGYTQRENKKEMSKVISIYDLTQFNAFKNSLL